VRGAVLSLPQSLQGTRTCPAFFNLNRVICYAEINCTGDHMQAIFSYIGGSVSLSLSLSLSLSFDIKIPQSCCIS
jgi:hypothetical protein